MQRWGGSVSHPKITLKSDYIQFRDPPPVSARTNNFPLASCQMLPVCLSTSAPFPCRACTNMCVYVYTFISACVCVWHTHPLFSLPPPTLPPSLLHTHIYIHIHLFIYLPVCFSEGEAAKLYGAAGGYTQLPQQQLSRRSELLFDSPQTGVRRRRRSRCQTPADPAPR